MSVAIIHLLFLFNLRDTLNLKSLHGKILVLLGSQLYQQLPDRRPKQENSLHKLSTIAWDTIHKSQGLTPEKVVVELGDKDFSASLYFVANSQF
jgi:hypothetical protein